jgi:hypothetical protein
MATRDVEGAPVVTLQGKGQECHLVGRREGAEGGWEKDTHADQSRLSGLLSIICVPYDLEALGLCWMLFNMALFGNDLIPAQCNAADTIHRA